MLMASRDQFQWNVRHCNVCLTHLMHIVDEITRWWLRARNEFRVNAERVYFSPDFLGSLCQNEYEGKSSQVELQWNWQMFGAQKTHTNPIDDIAYTWYAGTCVWVSVQWDSSIGEKIRRSHNNSSSFTFSNRIIDSLFVSKFVCRKFCCFFSFFSLCLAVRQLREEKLIVMNP